MTTASGDSDVTTSPRPATLATGSAMTRAPARRQKSSKRAHRERVGIDLVARRVADEDRERPRRRRRQALRAAQPVVGPARGERPRRAVGAEALAELVERRQQDLLDGALDGAQRERALHRAVGALELEAGERADERVRVGAERLTRAAHGGGDRQALLQRVAQRGDLAMGVQAVPAGRALRLGVAEPALPRAQGVRADVQQRGRFARLQGPHARLMIGLKRASCKSERLGNCTPSGPKAGQLRRGLFARAVEQGDRWTDVRLRGRSVRSAEDRLRRQDLAFW